MADEEHVRFTRTCVFCGQIHQLSMPKSTHDRWKNGEKIQDLLPDMPRERRETYITGTCKKCWDFIASGDD